MFVYPDLLAPEERGDGDEVARKTADQEHHAAEEGGHQHPVRVVLTCIQSARVSLSHSTLTGAEIFRA